MPRSDGPLLVFGPRSPTYDFGPSHPLTPRRFGPGIDLLRSVGAEPGLAPEPATDAELALVHDPAFVSTVRRLSEEPWAGSGAGFGPGDNPPFPGMHEAAASVAGGSLRAVEAILAGEVEHAFHPGGGLHHAMRDRASGFCIYDDPALAIARARLEGLRVLYLDFDTHHGDGVEAIFRDDPGVLTVSFHESGRYLFPGTGFAHEVGEGTAAGTIVNVPFEPYAGEASWLPAVEALVPTLAAAFGPDLIVSQHGADAHAWDPLAHLMVTTTAQGAAARLVDRLAHRHAGGRWLSTGGGGYDAYRVVPRVWSHVWLAGAHRPAPDATPAQWRERWQDEAARYGQAPLPASFDDPPNAGEPRDGTQDAADEASLVRALAIRDVVVPGWLRTAQAWGWWSPVGEVAPDRSAEPPDGEPTLVPGLDRATLEGLRLAPRLIPPADPSDAHALLVASLGSGRVGAAAAVVGDVVVGVAVTGPEDDRGDRSLAALGVAPAYRGRGLATALLGALVAGPDAPTTSLVTVAERDPVEPLPHATRLGVARRLLETAGFRVERAGGTTGRIDPEALAGRR
jgi:acetoin utilization protein AcuC